ncbi:MAG: PQQ-binding-like beta-propeller repeat protein, partial [Thermoplasmata archaeon]
MAAGFLQKSVIIVLSIVIIVSSIPTLDSNEPISNGGTPKSIDETHDNSMNDLPPSVEEVAETEELTGEEPSSRHSRNNQVDEWPMFRHDMRRTGNTTSRAPNINNIKWTHQTPITDYTWGYCGSPAVAGGLVFLGGQRPDVFRAIDAETGVQSWPYNVGNRVTSSPTVANNRVLFTSYSRMVYSLNINTGLEVWTAGLANYPDSSPTVYQGKVYVGDGEADYVASSPSHMYCLDENTGAVRWIFNSVGQIACSPTIVDDLVIFGSYDGFVYALPATDPNGDLSIDDTEIIWRFDAGSRIVASAAVVDGTVYIGAWNGKLYALPFTDPSGDGFISEDEIIWTFETGNQNWCSAGVANGRVFVGSHDHYIYALPQADPNGDRVISESEVLWKYQTTDKIWSSPAIAGGKV